MALTQLTLPSSCSCLLLSEALPCPLVALPRRPTAHHSALEEASPCIYEERVGQDGSKLQKCGAWGGLLSSPFGVCLAGRLLVEQLHWWGASTTLSLDSGTWRTFSLDSHPPSEPKSILGAAPSKSSPSSPKQPFQGLRTALWSSQVFFLQTKHPQLLHCFHLSPQTIVFKCSWKNILFKVN